MNSILKLHINQLIESIINDTYNNRTNCLLIKYYDDFCISMDEFFISNRYDDKVEIINHNFVTDKMLSPYEPFLDWIRDTIKKNKIDIDDLLEKSNIYYLQRDFIKEYIKTGKCIRKETVIIPEVKHEDKQFKKGLINIINYLSDIKPVIFILNNIHYGSESTFQLLINYINDNSKGNIAIICTYNELYKINDIYNDKWHELMDISYNHNIIVDAVDRDNKKIQLKSRPFVLDFDNYKEYLLLLSNMIETFALKQAKYYLDMIYQKFELEKYRIDNKLKYEFLEMLIKVNIYLGDNTQAVLLCDKLKQISEGIKDKAISFRCYYVCGITHIYTYEYDLVKNDISYCRLFATDDFELFKVDLLQCLSEYQGFKDVVLKNKKFIPNDNLIERAKRYKYYNNLAYIYAYCYGNSYELFEDNEDSNSYFDDGITLANKIGNDLCVLECYKKRVMVASWFARFDLIEYCYNECIKIIQKFNDEKQEADLYNGLGYLYCANENYLKANKFYEKALNILVKIKDLPLLSTTYYNKAINCILSEDYENGYKCIEITIKLMKSTNIFKLPVCNTSKIYGLAALCCYKMGLYYDCYLNIEIMEGYISHILNTNDESKYYLWDDDLFLYYFAKGLLCEFEEKYEEGREVFKRAFYHVTRSKGNQFFSYPRLSIEQAKLLKKLGEYTEAKLTLENCINYCMEKKYYVAANRLKEELTGIYKNNTIEIKNNKTNISKAINIAMTKKIEIENLVLTKHIRFIESFQDLISSGISSKELVQNAMLMLKNYFKLDEIIYLNINEDSFKIKYEAKKRKIDKNEIDKLVLLLKSKTEGFALSRIEKNFCMLDNIFTNIDINNIASFICVPIVENNSISDMIIAYIELHDNFTTNNYFLNEDNLVIFRSVFRQLNSELDKLSFKETIINMNQKLLVVNNELNYKAENDLLTGLYNRHGMRRIMNELTHNAIKKTRTEVIVIYIDLDNFKYYNDNFGHDIGDLVLTKFAKLLTKYIEKCGYCFRYGGDEFVVLLNDKSLDDAVNISKSILNEMKQMDHFEDFVSNALGNKISVPSDKKITCSIGIASTNFEENCDIYNAITNADKILYSIKNTTKNNYGVYNKDKK